MYLARFTHTDRQKDRQTDRDRDRQTDKQREIERREKQRLVTHKTVDADRDNP